MSWDNGSCALDHFLEKPLTLRVVVQIACTLSMIGSSVIILSYLCHKGHRTRARYILVHLSVSNLGQVLSNFMGVMANFDASFKEAKSFSYSVYDMNRNLTEKLCTAQAFFTVYFSISGMLWTMNLAVYLYLLILSMRQAHFTRYFVWLGYVVCYSLPLLVAMWLLLSDRLGYAPYSTPGYCGLTTRRPFQDRSVVCDPARDIYGEFMGFDVWIFLTIVVTLIFYITALCYLKVQQKELASDSRNFWKTVQNMDYKFIAIPLVFAVLRIWSLIVYLMFTYIGMDVGTVNASVVTILLYLMGIGNCAQGFIDAIIFVVFTQAIRENFIRIFDCRKKKKPRRPTLLDNETKNFYDNSLRNYGPRFSLYSTNPISVTAPKISESPEPSTDFQESPNLSYASIQTGCSAAYEYYTDEK